MNENNLINESISGTNIENYKIVILGDQFVGKTSILNKFKYENSEEKYTPTVGIDFITKNVYLEDKTIYPSESGFDGFYMAKLQKN